MASNENGNLWFLQQPPPPGADTNQQTPPAPPQQQTYQSPNPTNPFSKVAQSPPPQDGTQPGYPPQQYPPHQGSPYPQQQGGQLPPPQYASQPGTPYLQQAYSPPQQQGPYPPQQSVYAQAGPYNPPQQGYPQQQGSPYLQQGHPQQAYTQSQQNQFSDPDSQAGGESSSFYGSGPPPVVQPGPGPGGPGDRGFFDNAMQMAGVQQPPPGPDGQERGWFSSSKNPLDPPPKMFKRPAPGHYSYIKFQPMSVLAVSDKLQDGFALIPPVTAPGDQHPFVSHDITEDDWHKFLKDFQKTAHLSASDRLFQGMANSFMKDKIPSAKIQKRMAENKLEPIGDYLMAWNHYFFRPRRMSIVLARGSRRFSGETDDYPPDVTRHSKKAFKEKKAHRKSRSVDAPLVTVAEPYPRGSLLAPLLNPLHKAIYDTTVAVARAPGDLLHGIKPGERVNLSKPSPKSKSRALSDTDEESDSEEYTDSEEEEESDRDPVRAWQKKIEKDTAAIHRRTEEDLKAFHRKAAADREAFRTLREGRRVERRARMEDRKRERENFVQSFYYGNHNAGNEQPKKTKKHRKEKESGGDVPTGRFRLVMCYWDGQREVF